jgi:hypothetical protein
LLDRALNELFEPLELLSADERGAAEVIGEASAFETASLAPGP